MVQPASADLWGVGNHAEVVRMQSGPLTHALANLAAILREQAEEFRASQSEAEASALERIACDIRRAVATETPVAGAPLATDRLWTQREAAYYLGVGVRYLRESSCPKVLLPGAGKKGKSLVRYEPAAVMAWKDAWGTGHRRRAS